MKATGTHEKNTFDVYIQRKRKNVREENKKKSVSINYSSGNESQTNEEKKIKHF